MRSKGGRRQNCERRSGRRRGMGNHTEDEEKGAEREPQDSAAEKNARQPGRKPERSREGRENKQGLRQASTTKVGETAGTNRQRAAQARRRKQHKKREKKRWKGE